jgi:Na+/proline symporter
LLAASVALYLAASLAIGLYASRRVRGAARLRVAPRTFRHPRGHRGVFATWFGAENVLGIPATFMKEGLAGLVADPSRRSAASRSSASSSRGPLFRLSPLTLGDYFRSRYRPPGRGGPHACASPSPISDGCAAQFVALGLAFNVLSAGAIDLRTGVDRRRRGVPLYGGRAACGRWRSPISSRPW